MRKVIALGSFVAFMLLSVSWVRPALPDDTAGKTESSSRPESVTLPPDEQQAGFVRLWSQTKCNFAFFDSVPEVDWDKVLVKYLPQFAAPRSRQEYYRLLEKCLAQLRDGHTYVELAAFDESDRPAILVRPIEGRAIIVKVADDKYLAKQGVTVGCEILNVDGRDVKDILDEDICPYISASTPQMLAEQSYWRILDGPRDSEAAVVIRDTQGQERAITLVRDGRNRPEVWQGWHVFGSPGVGNAAAIIRESQAADAGGLPKTHGESAFEYRELDGGLAYVALRSFTHDECPREFDKALDKVRSSKGLIIDVRGNGGGSSPNGFAVIRRLIDKPLQNATWNSPQHIALLEAWGDPQKWFQKPMAALKPATDIAPFLGPVVVLTDAVTISAAEDFLIPLHYAHRATLVGEKTAGSTGQPLVMDLPGGGVALVCTARNTYPDGREFVGVGVIPDVEAHPTVEDVIAGRDAVLERGIEVMKNLSASVESTQ